jgi:hypothetical protein
LLRLQLTIDLLSRFMLLIQHCSHVSYHPFVTAMQLMLQSKHLRGNISWERWELRMLEKEMNAPEVM